VPEHLWKGEGREAQVVWCERCQDFCFTSILSQYNSSFPFLYLQGEINVSDRVGSKQTRQIFLVLLLLLLLLLLPLLHVVVAPENGDGRGMDEGAVPTRVPRRRRLRKEASIILIR